MQLKIAPNDVQSMSQDGDAILRSLQNNNLPIIDLIVRESLQNSLDATLENAKSTIVNFKFDSFDSEKLSKHMEGISEKLSKKYSGLQSFLSISDKNTNGLTGDFSSDSTEVLNSSNFYKLVFGIGKNQNKEGSGGSWGLGKTSYFRIGIGVVLYYTRVKIEDSYEERLIGSLIESPKQEERLLQESERGIAWWGEYDESGNKIFPIIDSEKITEILNIFGIENYKNNETGTTIIIPYLKAIDEDEKDNDIQVYPWERSVTDSINLAVQRWYSPRIWNEKYNLKLNNSILDCRINGIGIVPELNMEPTFEIFRNLYTSALVNEPQKENIKVEPIKLPRNPLENKKESVGHIAFCEVSKEDMQMLPPNNKASGLAYIGLKDYDKIKNNTSKVIAYSRKPGMIVEYCIDDEWTPNGIIQDENSMVFGFFVPNSEENLVKKYTELGYKNLESYLRSTENADHAKWEDADGIGIINRMKSYTSKAISREFQGENETENTSATSGLSRKYGTIFMPPKHFGKVSSSKAINGSRGASGVSKNRKADISINKTELIDRENVKVEFTAFLKKKNKSTIFLQVLTQEQKMNRDSWHKSMGENIEFPLKIEKVLIESIDETIVNSYYQQYNNQDFTFNLIEENEFDIISRKEESVEIKGVLFIKVKSNQYIPNVAIQSIKDENRGV
ncbi:hypothetical protein [Mammaliicoccus fleurettii]|uniref:hypothetical protein n=1 Tax=Mammaliicoccus fleurettii TaxID=150056 RepID=UPI002DBCEAD5|nr:hypothetical protein [Mammaliicoccus fleurettii]MEB8068150.1 hypothetical protein [Mammaliicoccus fleurettii]